MYDFANSAFTTLVVTFIYATYFASVIAPDSVSGQSLWGVGVTVSSLVVALLSPYTGAIADRGGYRKRFLFIATAVCILATVGLFFPTEGEITFALTLFVVANVAFELGIVFNNAFLPDLAPPPLIGRISGYAWGLGYLGGLLCMAVALVAFILPESPWFGLPRDGTHVRATNLLVAFWFALFSLPMFLFVPEPPVIGPRQGSLIRRANRQFIDTFREIRRYRQIIRLLVARLFYNDGLITIIAFGAIFADGVFGFGTEKILYFGILLNVMAGLGAFLFGFLDDRLGGKRTILVSVAGLFLASLLAVLTESEFLFWIAGSVVGLLMGPNQSASRSLMGRFVPDDKESEFFGFYAFSGKATAFIGPSVLAWMTTAFDSQRIGISVVLVLFALGGLLLLRVDEEEGIRLSGRVQTGGQASAGG
ncbi:MAG: MFS transporter [Bacteroidetes bacterium]|nr:MAG: MFS transporter [Bacteroidota bacterium]